VVEKKFCYSGQGAEVGATKNSPWGEKSVCPLEREKWKGLEHERLLKLDSQPTGKDDYYLGCGGPHHQLSNGSGGGGVWGGQGETDEKGTGKKGGEYRFE